MTAMVNRSPFDSWTWEILDEDSETYLRSDRCFADYGTAVIDLEGATCLIRPYIQLR